MKAYAKVETLKTVAGLPQYMKYPYDVFSVGDKVHICFHTDVVPGTVTEVKRNGREVIVQRDTYELQKGEQPDFIPGGFAGHCTNQRELKYSYSRNEKGAIYKFTIRKWRGRYVWTPKGGSPDGYQRLGLGWAAHYDYNF